MEKTKAELWIDEHEQEIIEFLQTIIRMPSVTGDEAKIQAHMGRVLEEMGREVDTFVPSAEELKKHPAYVSGPDTYENRPNMVGILRGTGGGLLHPGGLPHCDGPQQRV